MRDTALAPGGRMAVFTDLDDTLFQTARKLDPAAKETALLAAIAGNGKHSYMTRAQGRLLAWMRSGLVIPVTARGSEAFGRVAIAFSGSAIVANGAVILNGDGRADPQWQARMRAGLEPVRAILDGLPEIIRKTACDLDLPVRTWLVEELSLGGVYAVVKTQASALEGKLAELAPRVLAAVASRDVAGAWRLHLNGNNLALIPPTISKGKATAFLLERLRREGLTLAVGVGDSASDLDFMRLCDLWMTPCGSQIDAGAGDVPDGARTGLHAPLEVIAG